MRCFTDDAVTELAMKARAGEAVGERDQAHLDECTECREAVARQTATARELARAVRTMNVEAPGPCLSDNDLTEFVDGALDEADAARVEQHLARCGDCLRSIAELDTLLQAADTAASPVRYAIRLVKKGAEFIAQPERGFRKSMLAYVPTLKGPDDARELCAWSQNVDGHPLHFKLQRGDGDRVHLTLSVDSRNLDPARTQVTLRKDGDLVQSEALGADRLVRLPDLQRGVYSFEIQAANEVDLRVEIDLQ